VPTLHSLTLEQWIERYRILSEKNGALMKGGLDEKQPAGLTAGKPESEHPRERGGGQSADRERKDSRAAAKSRSRAREPRGSGHSERGTGAPRIVDHVLHHVDLNRNFA
jgi:hypothetical protein